MSKNQLATDRVLKKKDTFFKKSSQKFNKPKNQHRNKKEETRTEANSNSNNFFVKSIDRATSRNAQTSQGHELQNKSEFKSDKKPFDKKRYRLQKYSKKYQLQQWEEKRKKAVLRSYYKTLKDDEINSNSSNVHSETHRNEFDNLSNEETTYTDVKETLENEAIALNDTSENVKKKQVKPFHKAHQEFERIKEEKEKKKELLLTRKKEKEEAMQKYKKNKIEKYKKLNKKTKKGQPIMKDRIEMLLERIQNSIKKE